MNKIKLLLGRYKVYKLYHEYYNCNDHKECEKIAIKILELEKTLLSNERRYLIKQSLMVYCPNCGQEMCFHPDSIKYKIDNDYERIICGNCTHMSLWYTCSLIPSLIE